MDYTDYLQGATNSHFWFRAKLDLIKVLTAKILVKPNQKVLIVGAGTGEELKLLEKSSEVYIIDIDEKALELIPRGLCKEKRRGDICCSSFEDNFFDLVLCFDVLEHIADDKLALLEISRLLKTEGKFIFTVPAYNFLYSPHDTALRHFRRYSRNSLRKKLSYFKQIKCGYWFSALFFPVLLKRVIKDNYFNFKREILPDSALKLPAAINGLFYKILSLENFCIGHNLGLPFGLTLYGVYQNNKIIFQDAGR